VRMPPIKPYKLALKIDALKKKGEEKKIYYHNIYDTPVTFRVQVDPVHAFGILTVKVREGGREGEWSCFTVVVYLCVCVCVRVCVHWNHHATVSHTMFAPLQVFVLKKLG
jgi:hypothetical protein